MARTAIADVVIPEVFADYLMEPILIKNALFDSGIVEYDALLASKLDRGGDDFTFPYWGALEDDSLYVPTEDGANTPTKITSGSLRVPRQFRAHTAGANKMASILAGDNAMEAIQERVVQAWQTGIQLNMVSTLTGLLGTTGGQAVTLDAAAADETAPTVANNISAEYIIDAKALLGDQGNQFNAMLMHSAVYAEMLKLDLIEYVPLSSQDGVMEMYQGMRVIVDDRLYNFTRLDAPLGNDVNVYTTFLLKGAAFKYGDSMEGFTPVHIENDETLGIGVETLYTRKMFAVHPMGFDWTGTPAGSAGPTDAELATSGNWELKFGANTLGFVAIYTNAV